jgi:hypothetical protein
MSSRTSTSGVPSSLLHQAHVFPFHVQKKPQTEDKFREEYAMAALGNDYNGSKLHSRISYA